MIGHEIGIHIVVGGHLSRGVEDNISGKPLVTGNRNATCDDEMRLLNESSDYVLIPWRSHKCHRGVGAASAYDIEGRTEIAVYQNMNSIGTIDSYYDSVHQKFVFDA